LPALFICSRQRSSTPPASIKHAANRPARSPGNPRPSPIRDQLALIARPRLDEFRTRQLAAIFKRDGETIIVVALLES
jgi:hypothetical protein